MMDWTDRHCRMFHRQITRHSCGEGWSAIGSWTGTPLRHFLKLIGADTRAKYCWFQCGDQDGYNSPLDMETALHPQTLLAYEMNGKPLSWRHGAPLRLAIPLKYGIKNIKRIGTIRYTDVRPADYWAERGYDWYAGH